MRYERVTLPNGVRVLVTDMPDARSASIAVYVGVESERNVIVEEIRMYRDQAQDRVHTLIDELLYPNHPLGWEIAGRQPVVLGLTAPGLRAFMETYYAPERIVVAIAGRIDEAEAITAVRSRFGDLAARPPIVGKAAPRAGRIRSRTLAKRGEQ